MAWSYAQSEIDIQHTNNHKLYPSEPIEDYQNHP
jgi:hypothetical protein